MMIIKKAILIVIAICFVFSLCIIVYADEKQNKPNMTNEHIYELLMSDAFDGNKGITVDKLDVEIDSITRVYTVDLHQYAETEKLEVIPLNETEGDAKGSEVYVAKIVGVNGIFCGNMRFSILNGKARFMVQSLTPMYKPEEYDDLLNFSYQASCSFEDNREILEELLGCNVSKDNVRYTVIDRIGPVYYVKNESVETFVYCFYVRNGKRNVGLLSKEEVLQTAKEWQELEKTAQEVKEKWEKEHPGEQWTGLLGGADLSGNTAVIKSGASPDTWIIVLVSVSSVVVLSVITALIIIRIKRKKKESV